MVVMELTLVFLLSSFSYSYCCGCASKRLKGWQRSGGCALLVHSMETCRRISLHAPPEFQTVAQPVCFGITLDLRPDVLVEEYFFRGRLPGFIKQIRILLMWTRFATVWYSSWRLNFQLWFLSRPWIKF